LGTEGFSVEAAQESQYDNSRFSSWFLLSLLHHPPSELSNILAFYRLSRVRMLDGTNLPLTAQKTEALSSFIFLRLEEIGRSSY
jgi:hypothetical protein